MPEVLISGKNRRMAVPRQITGLGLVSLTVAISCATGLPARADYRWRPMSLSSANRR